MKHHDFPPRQEWHELGCSCRRCEPNARPLDDVTGQQLGAIAILATIVVTAVMLAIDPTGTIATLTSTVAF